MESDTGAAPPAPPPPPPLLSAGALLAGGGRPPANSEHVGRNAAPKSTRPPERPTFAGVDSQTLQHAAASLRKTQYGESLLSRDSQPNVGGPNQLPVGRHWTNREIDEALGENHPGAPLHAPTVGAHPPAPFGVSHERVDPLTTYAAPPATGFGIDPVQSSINVMHPIPITHQQQPPASYQYSFSSSAVPQNAPSTYSYAYSSTSSYNNGVPQALNNSSSSNTVTTSNQPPHVTNISVSQQPIPPPNSVAAGTGSNGYSSPAARQHHHLSSPAPYQPQSQVSPQQGTAYTASGQPSALLGMSGGHSPQHPAAALITDPQAYIHHYATQTPASVLNPDPNGMSPQSQHSSTTTTTTRIVTTSEGGENLPLQFVHSSAFPPMRRVEQRTSDFVRELRDSGLTESQKYSNQFQHSAMPERLPPTNAQLQSVFQETKKYFSTQQSSSVSPPSATSLSRELTTTREEEGQQQQQHQQQQELYPVNHLIKEMEWKLRTNIDDLCSKCGTRIEGDTPGVTALGNAFHVNCFTCDECHKQLAGCSFYNVDGKNLCQVDYMASLEKCEKCATPITQKILRAMGKPFHPECFVCPACTKSLDGVPFTLDKENSAYCLDCYHERFSPRCAICLKAIAPTGNETEVARVIAMDRSYHIDCYRCEDCGLKLNSKIEGQGCYPLESHLFCKNCNLNRLKSVR